VLRASTAARRHHIRRRTGPQPCRHHHQRAGLLLTPPEQGEKSAHAPGLLRTLDLDERAGWRSGRTRRFRPSCRQAARSDPASADGLRKNSTVIGKGSPATPCSGISNITMKDINHHPEGNSCCLQNKKPVACSIPSLSSKIDGILCRARKNFTSPRAESTSTCDTISSKAGTSRTRCQTTVLGRLFQTDSMAKNTRPIAATTAALAICDRSCVHARAGARRWRASRYERTTPRHGASPTPGRTEASFSTRERMGRRVGG